MVYIYDTCNIKQIDLNQNMQYKINELFVLFNIKEMLIVVNIS